MDLPGVRIVEDFFPNAILNQLVEEIQSSSIRKLEFRLWPSTKQVPQSVAEAAEFAAAQTGLQFNVAILKWYRLTDERDSLAYIVHRDPEELRSIPLVLCTLRGQADLIYWDSAHNERTVNCRSNMAVLLDAELEHQVTPPLGPEGERFLLFLGLNTKLAAESRG